MKTGNTSLNGGARASEYPADVAETVPILLVDDREENLVALEAVLRDPGYKLYSVSSGDDALRFLLDRAPALILMDVQMPGLDGYETAAIIKNNQRTRDIPIIFITAINTDEHYVYRGYEHGAIDYIYKPFDAHVLRSKVAVLADLHRKTERLVRTEKALRESELRERERRIAELELRALRREQVEQARYRSLVESIEHGVVWSAAPDSLYPTFVSRSSEKLLGYADESLLENPGLFLSSIVDEDRGPFLAAVKEATSTGAEVRLEHRMRTSRGDTAWFHTGLRAGARSDGTGLELRGLSLDISALKDAQSAIADSKHRSDVLSRASLLLGERLGEVPMPALLAALRGEAFDFCAFESFDTVLAPHAVATGDAGTDEKYLALPYESPRSGTRVIESDPGPDRWRELLGSPGRAGIAVELGLATCLQIGVSARGEPLGVLTFANRAGRRLADAETALADDLAVRIASAIENYRLYLKADSAIRLRDEFLSIASHELRTPLTPLKIRIQQMQRLLDCRAPSLSAEQLSKNVQTCHRQIERLSKLVDDLLDISRISRGQLSLHAEKFDLGDLIRDIVARFGSQLDAAGTTVDLRLEKGLEVCLDLSRIEQVVVNLLTNAIKYAPGKPIEIAAVAEGDQIEFRVKDHGIGIARGDQERIFRRFERAVSSNHFGGLGLGLYIVTQILSAHGGRISVQSEEGNGAEFTVRLPRRLPETATTMESTG